MKNYLVTTINEEELRNLLRDEIRAALKGTNPKTGIEPEDEIGQIDIAIAVTGLSKSTIYRRCSERSIPHFKRGKRLYFSKRDLLGWISNGKRKTASEIASEADGFGNGSGAALVGSGCRS